MTTHTRAGLSFFLLVLGVAGCGGPSSIPTAPTATVTIVPQPTAPPPSSWSYGSGYSLVGASLFGVVSEETSTGMVPVAGVSVYCDACGEFGHTFTSTDANGFYSFSGDVARGGGVWLSGQLTPLLVRKDGYAVSDPAGTFPDGTGRRYASVYGDTRFDILLVRR